jgi:hypothetical protein
MTEAALASKESLMQYISKQHLLELIGEQMEDIEVSRRMHGAIDMLLNRLIRLHSASLAERQVFT